MTTDEIKKAISSKLDRIAEEISKNKDIIIKKTKDDIKIQAIDYKRV
jgi:predicted transcriptional regulator